MDHTILLNNLFELSLYILPCSSLLFISLFSFFLSFVSPFSFLLFFERKKSFCVILTRPHIHFFHSLQGMLKGEISLYHWPPVWLVRNQLYDNWQILFLFTKQTNPNQSNRRSTVQWYFPLLVFPALSFHPHCGASAVNTKGGSITVPLTSCLTGLDLSVL